MTIHPTIPFPRIDEFFFPVGIHDLFFDEPRTDKVDRRRFREPLNPYYAQRFKAVVDEERWEMLSCVSSSYSLITNKWAYYKGIEVATRIIGISSVDCNFGNAGFTSPYRGSCFMDIVAERSLQIKACKHEWFAFVRMKNSYDKKYSLMYEVGFYLETMDNRQIPLGLLIPSLSLKFQANHSWSLKTIEAKINEAILQYSYGGASLINQFEIMVRDLMKIEVVDDEILPLFCKLANIPILDETKPNDVKYAHKLIQIEKDSSNWINTCGPNAYAALCAYADFASRYADDKEMTFLDQPSAFQSQLGKFFESLLEESKAKGSTFSLDTFIGKTARDAKKKIKLICHN